MNPICTHRCWVEINLDNLIHNVSFIMNKKLPSEKIMAVVKGNGYGCGATMIADTLYNKFGISDFAVANLHEAKKLRMDGISGNILVFGYTPVCQVKELASLNVMQTLIDEKYSLMLSKSAKQQGVEIPIHIALDTGMNRIGFLPSENFKRVLNLPNLIYKGAYTHLSHADSCNQDSTDFTLRQIETFKRQTVGLENLHVQNSAAVIKGIGRGFDYIRPGIILYGISPSSDILCDDILEVMSLKSVVSMVKTIDKGQYVGYSRTFKTKQKMRIATIPIGYADGYSRAFSNKGEVLILGKRAKIVGLVCMDQLMVDVSDIPCKLGDEVVFWGSDGKNFIKADDLAQDLNTIGYEIISGISTRVPRVYYRNGKILGSYYL